MMSCAELNATMKSALAAKGWRYERIHRLRPVYVLSTTVTPYFGGSVRISLDSYYRFDGTVGVLSRRFEDARANGLERCSRYGFDATCLALHIFNVDRLREAAYISPENQVGDCLRFCDLLTDFLLELPTTEDGLRAAFFDKCLGHIDFDKFMLPATLDEKAKLKLHDLRQFLGLS